MERVVTIELKGSYLEVKFNEALELKVRERYQLQPNADVSGDLIKAYLQQELGSALEKQIQG